MSRRFWIVAAACAALTMVTFTPDQAQAGWRRRCCGRMYGCSYRGYARCGGWGGGWGGYYGGFRGCGYGGYGMCSNGYYGGNYMMTGFGSPYMSPYAGSYAMPYYANMYSGNPYVSAGYLARPAAAPGFYMTAASQPVAPAYPGDPVQMSAPAMSFAARMTALINSGSSTAVAQAEPAPARTSFLARHGSGFSKSNVAANYGYSYQQSVANAPTDLSNFGLLNVAMNR